MYKQLRMLVLRGCISYYTWVKRFYDALLMTWHKSVAVALFAGIVVLASVCVLGIAIWVFAGAVASALHGDILDGFLWLLVSMALMILSRFGVNYAKELVPIGEVIEEEADEVDI